MAETKDEYYINLLDKNPSGFLNILNRNIVKGDSAKTETLKQLDVICPDPQREQFLCGFQDSYGDCLIHNVAKFHKSVDVLKVFLTLCPKSLTAEREDRFSGQTALHIVVTKLNLRAARTILKYAGMGVELSPLLHTRATGSLFSNTVMMGELALSIAALSLHESMVDLLLKHSARVSEQNSKGDTVFHSLIKFAVIHPEKIDGIINMIEHINGKLSPNDVSVVWYNAENDQNLTALKLAASLGQVEIFSSILKLEDVYCKLNHHDGLFDVYLFDITEIDTITQAEWERNKKSERESRNMYAGDLHFQRNKKKPAAQSHHPALIHRCPAVLDIICHLPTATAFQLMNVDVVKDIVTTKWAHYRMFYYLWFLCHFLMMSVITAYAVFKTKVINEHIYSPDNTTLSDSYETTRVNDTFVFVISVLSCVYALPYIVYEAFRSFYFRQFWYLHVIHHNGLYRCLMLAMSIALVIDAVWFWVQPDNNYFLIAALLIGWTFMNFFLRALKIFSFFTVMLQKVLLGDMTRFSVIILFQLVAFSIAMYITFLNTKPLPSEFDHLGMTMMTMFKLMLGLTDIEILYDARHPWMAIFLYIACTLVTYVLLINSLIALMSQTCALVSEDRRMQWELQRLSVIHLVETMLLPRWRYLHKPGLKARRYNLHNQATEWRCFNEITSIQTTYTDGAAILRRKSMIRTIGFEDSVLSPMAPFFNRHLKKNASIHSIPIYQNAASLRTRPIFEDENEDGLDSSDDDVQTPQDRNIQSTTKPGIKEKGELLIERRSNKQTRIHSPTNSVELEKSEMPAEKENSGVHVYAAGNGNVKPITEPNKLLHPQTGTKPRKRHNSEQVNRKTQTTVTTPLSHSFPDGSLRAPLRQGASPPSPPSLSDINPRIVYVVPTSMLDQPALSNLAEIRPLSSHFNYSSPQIVQVQESPLQTNYVTDSGNVYAQVLKSDIIPKLKDATDKDLRGPQLEVNDVKGQSREAIPQAAQSLQLPVVKVQTLDIDTLHSSV